MNIFRHPFFALVMAGTVYGATAVGAVTLTVTGSDGKPVATVMVTQTLTQPARADTSDKGYATPGTPQPKPKTKTTASTMLSTLVAICTMSGLLTSRRP